MSLDPTVLDASAINDAGEFVMMLFDDVEWENTQEQRQEHQQQLQAKIAVYMEMAKAKTEAENCRVRIMIAGMYEPDEAGRQFISTLRSVVESANIAFSYAFHPVPEW